VTLAIIGGSGFESLPDFEIVSECRLRTRCGLPSGPIVEGRLASETILFISRHGPDHRIPPHRINYRANLLALQSRGATTIIGINAVGGIAGHMATGSVVVCDQLIDYTWGREQTFSDGVDQPLQHIDFTQPYDEPSRRWLLEGAVQAGETVVDGGVCGIIQGPRLETAAEIRRMERDGCELVGMTGMPEASLARELGIAYACLALVVNPAAGKSKKLITLDDIQVVMNRSIPRVMNILRQCCSQKG